MPDPTTEAARRWKAREEDRAVINRYPNVAKLAMAKLWLYRRSIEKAMKRAT